MTTGPGKLHPRAAVPDVPTPDEMACINAESAADVADVDAARAAWAGVDPGGIAASAVHVRRLRRRRVRTRGAGWRTELAALTGVAAAAGGAGIVAAASAPWAVVAASVVAAGAGLRAAVVVRGRRRDERTTLLAVAEGVAAGLVATGRRDLTDARVVVEPGPGGGWVALVDGVSDDATAGWADALAETLGPLGTPRWMVAVDEPGQVWRVPSAVGTTRRAAEAFAAAVRARVPGAELVRAGTPRATRLVLAARPRGDEIERSLRWR